MTSDDGVAGRLETLESAIAYQEHTITELNEVVAAQWSEIIALQRRLSNLEGQVRQVEAHPALADREPPPPHY